jgi:proline iminopeptidase
MMEPYAQGYLPSDNGHDVAWYEFGSPHGLPVLFLHGGPGSGFGRDYLNFFPLERVRLIAFDQRGCGQSKPLGKLEHNNTDKLLYDIERLREQAGVDRWIVAGHSWGTTLAVIYAKAYAQYCRKLLLVSFFGGQPHDQEWTFDGLKIFFPEEVAALHSLKPPGDARHLREWIIDALNGPAQLETAFALSRLAGAASRLTPKPVQREDITEATVINWRLLFHYGYHDFFVPPGELLRDVSMLTMPIYLLHGRFDMDCPIEQAYRLKAALPKTDLKIVSGNHSSSEEPMFSAFRALTHEICSEG